MQPTVCPVLVGRRAEWSTLERRLDAAAAGAGGVAVLFGDAGLGTSRLAGEPLVAASARGLRSAAGRAVAGGSPVPFRPLTEALRPVGRARRAASWSRRCEAVRARARLLRVVARLPLLGLPEPVGRQPLAYLLDIGFTRDVWMHRIDVARATGSPLDVDAGRDGRIVADLVAEWATRHGEPCTLELTGPAGGRYTSGEGGEHVDMDAIEFCWVLSERGEGRGVLRHRLPL